MSSEFKKNKYIDFIGIGAQKAATSWIYACLNDHPEVCMPIKEINFFSRDRNWKRGFGWYYDIYSNCGSKIKGEFSTSYLSCNKSPSRIFSNLGDIKIIVCLRNPIDRAYSNYINDIKSGVVGKNTTFSQALKSHPEYIESAKYYEQLSNYMRYFSKDKIFVLIYDDIEANPLAFIQSIYKFIGVNDKYTSSFTDKKLNTARVPHFIFIDKFINTVSLFMNMLKIHYFAWLIKKTRLPSLIRSINTKNNNNTCMEYSDIDKKHIYSMLSDDISKLESILGRTLPDWHY